MAPHRTISSKHGGRFAMHHGVPTPIGPRHKWSYKTWRNPYFDSDGVDDSLEETSDMSYRAAEAPQTPFTRREINYNDRGRRQRTSSRGDTRDEVFRDRSRSPDRSRSFKRSESPLFFPEVSISDIEKTPTPMEKQLVKVTSRSNPAPTPLSELPVEAPGCTCPIGYDCSHRGAQLLDCRPLVAEWKQISERMDEEAYIRQVTRSCNPAGRQITAQRLSQVSQYLQQIETLPMTLIESRKSAFQKLERWIHEVKNSDVAAADLQSAQVLPRLATFLHQSNAQMRQNKGVSDWFEEELTYIYRKLGKGDILCNPNRGLTEVEIRDVNGTVTRTSYRLDKSWQFYTDARYFGAGELVNGQLWFSRQQLMRDGVHAPKVGGIAGTAKGGAYSIVMGLHTEKNKYADVDMYNIIEYEGTALRSDVDPPEPTNEQDAEQDTRNFNTDITPTTATRALMKSLENGKPVRVIRSFRAAPIVTNKPAKGYRYDGLYIVTRKTPQKEKRQIWSFRLERIAGQGRLRGVRDNERRPSNNRRKGWSRF